MKNRGRGAETLICLLRLTEANQRDEVKELSRGQVADGAGTRRQMTDGLDQMVGVQDCVVVVRR